MHIVVSHPEVLWGVPVFQGTKVPAETLFDYLEDGETVESFLRDFPNVTRDAALASLRTAGQAFIERELVGGK